MQNASVAPEQLTGKTHFEILDGLRGIAALAVVIFHFTEWIFPERSGNFIGHGFLAVDFFFCLSGFVISYSYDNRILHLGKLNFFKIRLIRLHPLVVLGFCLGIMGYFLDPFASSSDQNIGQIVLIFIASLFLIPLPLMEDRAFNLFAFNGPAWSLLWEYIANFLYALILARIGRRFLIILTILAAVCLWYTSYKTGSLIGGSSKYNFWDGGVRVAYSFTAGLLLYRSNWIIKNGLSFPMLAILLSFAFLMPWFSWNWLSEALVVIFYFPLIVALGAGSTLSSNWKKICRFSGNISYPLYMTHYAAIWIFGSYYTTTKPSTEELTLVVIGGTIFLVAFAYFVMVFYDLPVRKYLARRWK